jgi:hypothetical protein
MNDVQVYWRDKVTQLLGWSTGLLFVFIGWSVEHHSEFEWGPWSQGHADPSDTRDAIIRAIGLIIFAALYSVIFPLCVRAIYKRFLRRDIDDTVLRYSLAMTFAVGLSVLIDIVALLTAIL